MLAVDNRLNAIERQLLKLTGLGSSECEMARQVKLSVRSVHYILKNIARKQTSRGES